MIDSSRHFLPVLFIKHIIDGMSANKLNVLHWHIVDSNSFPFVFLFPLSFFGGCVFTRTRCSAPSPVSWRGRGRHGNDHSPHNLVMATRASGYYRIGADITTGLARGSRENRKRACEGKGRGLRRSDFTWRGADGGGGAVEGSSCAHGGGEGMGCRETTLVASLLPRHAPSNTPQRTPSTY